MKRVWCPSRNVCGVIQIQYNQNMTQVQQKARATNLKKESSLLHRERFTKSAIHTISNSHKLAEKPEMHAINDSHNQRFTQSAIHAIISAIHTISHSHNQRFTQSTIHTISNSHK